MVMYLILKLAHNRSYYKTFNTKLLDFYSFSTYLAIPITAKPTTAKVISSKAYDYTYQLL